MRTIALIGPLMMLAAGLAAAQHRDVQRSAAGEELEVHGSFRRLAHTGDTAGKVALGAIRAGPGVWGVGALAGLEGELVVADGRVLVSRGGDYEGRTEAPAPSEMATLYAGTKVSTWSAIRLPNEMNRQDFERFLVMSAMKLGAGQDAPFVFRVEGAFPKLVWHVVRGKVEHGRPVTAHGGQHANPHAAMHVFDEPGSRGQLIGVHSGAALEGVVSHPGERLHIHFADRALARSGHVDDYSVAAGAILYLPRSR